MLPVNAFPRDEITDALFLFDTITVTSATVTIAAAMSMTLPAFMFHFPFAVDPVDFPARALVTNPINIGSTNCANRMPSRNITHGFEGRDIATPFGSEVHFDGQPLESDQRDNRCDHKDSGHTGNLITRSHGEPFLRIDHGSARPNRVGRDDVVRVHVHRTRCEECSL